ncbi:MAG: hypothetical protein AB7P40_15345 [Chloroflexota bacterium]
MAITLELYLAHQVIRGDMRDDSGQRTIDVLNAATSQVIALGDALAASIHVQAPPARLGAVRIRRPQILIIVPQTVEALPPRRVRVGYVEKRLLHVGFGLGPFTVTGGVHVNPNEQNPIASLEHDASGRFFIPVTNACLKSQYDPRWSLPAELLFINRGAISYSYALAAA